MTYLKHRLYLICFFGVFLLCSSIKAQTLSFSITNGGKELSSSCIGTSLTFTNTSSVNGDNLSWTYGNNTTTGNSFIYSFTTAGTYIITLKNTSTNESVSKQLTIYSNPTASLSISQTSTCTGNPITFNATANTSSTIKNYIWSFGNGSSVTQSNITSHSYNQSGNYNAFLYVEDINGCRSNATETKSITVLGALNIGFTANGTDYFSCDNNINFQNTTGENGTSGIIYTWDFGDGTTSTEKNPGNHSYNSPGKYTVRLVANIPGNNNCTPGFTKDIYIGKPTIQINTTTTNICVNTQTSIKASMSPANFLVNNQDILWSTNNGNFNSDSTAITFTNAGTATITATNTNGCQASTTTTFTVNDAPNVTLNISPNYGICTQTDINFGISSGSNNELTYKWDLGDGTNNTNSTFSHRYNSAGNYTTTLNLTNNLGCTRTLSQVIPVSDKCIDNGVGSTYNPSFGFYSVDCDHKNILKFYNKDTLKTVSTWIIDNVSFTSKGDTTIINLPIKDKEDTYNVQVKYTDGSFDIVREITIIDETADFSYNNSDNKDNLLCSFNNITFDASKFVNVNNLNGKYLWKINDINGNSIYNSTTSTPILSNYTFDSTGNYTVELQISDLRKNACTSTASKSLLIKGTIVSFNADSTVYCNVSQKKVTFHNTSKNTTSSIKNFVWGFGDTENRTVSGDELTTIKNYNISQKNIQYTVFLTAIDNDGCSSYLRKWGYLSISNPSVAFSTKDTILCSSNKIIIQNNSNAWTPSTYLWTVGNYSKTYQNRSDLNINVNIDTFPKTFDVNLKVIDGVGCTKDTTIKNYIKFLKPKASFSIVNSGVLTTCPPYTLQLKNTSTNSDSLGVWNFSDGTSDLGDDAVYYSVLHPGNNTIKLINYGFDACTDTISQTFKAIGPVANLTTTDSIGCLPLKSDFNISSSDSIVSYQWSLGDGSSFNSTSIKNYSHNYNTIGNFWPSVLVIGGPAEGGCTDLLTLKDSIIVNTQYPKIDVVNKDANCSIDTTIFLNIKSQSGFPVKQYTWHWNDESPDQITDADSIKHIFSGNNLTYPIFLSAESEYCKVNSDTLNAAYHLKPIVNFESPAELCKNDSIYLISSITNIENTENSYNWYFGNALIHSGYDSIYSDILPKLDFKNITLVVKSAFGCTDSISKPINLLDLPKITFNKLDNFCTGDSIVINNTSDANTFQWNPTKYIVDNTTQKPTIFPKATQIFYVDLTGTNNCNNRDSIIVNVDPKVGLSFTDNYNYCLSDSTNLNLKVSAINSDQFIWTSSTPNGYMSSDKGNSITVKPITSTTYKVIGVSQNSCPDEFGNILVNTFLRPEISFASKIISIGAGEYFNLNPIIKNNNGTVFNYQWTPTTGLDNPYSENPKAISDKDITYTVNIGGDFGCASSDSIIVKVLCSSSKLYMANAFTPNGDGKNDIFYVTGYGIKSVEHFIIVDRWGKKMFERNNIMSNDISQGWDGTANGKQVEPGTYMYYADIICTEGQKYQLKGSVTLIR